MSGTPARHYGMDWLRIGAFALLILFHSALYFGPDHWLVKAATPQHWLAYPFAALTPWRLMVLFAVSGYASAAMLAKSGNALAFFKERSARLLIPLIFGMVVIVPPQSWVQLVTEHGLQTSYGDFWLHDDFRFGTLFGHSLPHWMHLWFLAYLWAYTAMLVLVMALVPTWKLQLTRLATWLGVGHRLLFLPIALLSLLRLSLDFAGFGGSGMFTDWVGDVHYIPAFLLGFALAHVQGLWSVMARLWRPALLLSLCALEVNWALLNAFGAVAAMPTSFYGMDLIAETVMAWAMLPVAFQLANTLLNHDHRWRLPLAQAIFPAYIVHQSVIVLLGWYLLRFSLPASLAFVIIVSVVLITSVAAWLLARRFPLIGLVLGLPAKNMQGARRFALKASNTVS